MELSHIWFIIHYPNNFVNIRRYITNVTQFNSPMLITYSEAPYHLHVGCSCLFVCLFSWHYNPLWLYFSQPGSRL